MFKFFIQNMIFWDREEYTKNNPYFTKENCPFCEEIEEDKKLILHETDFWQIRFNKFPYYWNNQNLMAFPKKHKTYTTELSDEEILDYKNVEKYMKDYFKWKNYYSFIRQGTWWRSIEHIHYHYLEWIIYHAGEKNKQTFKIKTVS